MKRIILNLILLIKLNLIKNLILDDYAFSGYYLGCYNDSDSSRDLSGYNDSDPLLTNKACIRECGIRNFKYAGKQSGYCFCGNNYGRYGLSNSDSDCDQNCEITRTNEKCGSSVEYKSTVYEVKKVKRIIDYISKIYVGCYADFFSNRDLDGAALMDINMNMTIESCIQYCNSLNFVYSGLQKLYCFCSSSYGYYQNEPSNCSSTCFGNSSQICGGNKPLSLSIYYTYASCKSQKFLKINRDKVKVTSFNEIILIGSHLAYKIDCVKKCYANKKCDLIALIKNECYLFNGFIGFVDFSLEKYFKNISSVFYYKKCFY